MDLQNLVSHVLQKPRAWIIAHSEFELSGFDKKSLDSNLEQLIKGTPLAYILGTWEFFSLDFIVNKNVLIPRPETEMMVEMALNWMKSRQRSVLGIDVGTGSACIPVSLVHNHSGLNFTACDISKEALKTARKNVQKYALTDRINLVYSDLLSAFKTRFDLICANLPYIPSGALEFLAVSRQEPLLALDGGVDGLDLIRKLLQQMPSRMAADGLAILEIEESQGELVLAYCRSIFQESRTYIQKDYSGRDRFLIINNGER